MNSAADRRPFSAGLRIPPADPAISDDVRRGDFARMGAGPERSSPEDCPALDVPDLLDRCLGNLELLERLLTSFESRFWGDVEAIRSGVAARDQKVVARLAHRLKGAAASVSAVRLARAAERIEELARQDDLEDVPDFLDELNVEWSRFEQSRALTDAAGVASGRPTTHADSC
jgi:HPt (histidine-containing phosphotransfer) domain-containing protein